MWGWWSCGRVLLLQASLQYKTAAFSFRISLSLCSKVNHRRIMSLNSSFWDTKYVCNGGDITHTESNQSKPNNFPKGTNSSLFLLSEVKIKKSVGGATTHFLCQNIWNSHCHFTHATERLFLKSYAFWIGGATTRFFRDSEGYPTLCTPSNILQNELFPFGAQGGFGAFSCTWWD